MNIENNTPSSGTSLVALGVAEDAAVAVARIMTGLPAALRIYQDQAIRAAASAALNVAEDSGRGGRDQKRFWRVAYSSAVEARTAVRIVVRLGAIDRAAGHEAARLLDRTAALTYGLWRGRS